MKFNLNGIIASDEDAIIYKKFGWQTVCPADLRQALADNPPDETFVMEINSGGGDVMAGFEIYSLLRGASVPVRAEVQSLAASAASVVLMGADTAAASPVAQIMIHLPSARMSGNQLAFRQGIQMLESVTDSILNAYEKKSRGKITRNELRKLMDEETFLTPQQALEWGLLDEIMEESDRKQTARITVSNIFGGLPDIEKIREMYQQYKEQTKENPSTADQLSAQKRRNLIALAEADANYIEHLYRGDLQ